jgi:multidrug efflux pump
MLVLAGMVARATIPVEADPDISIPLIMVTVPHPGISPEDSDRLIVRPMETEIRSIEGIDEVTAYAREGFASLMLEFDVDHNIDLALSETRAAVDRAQAEIPGTTEEPIIKSVSVTDFPVIVISLSSDTVPERVIYNLALSLKHDIEMLPSVLEARLSGHREELLEAIIDPTQLEFYAISSQDMFRVVRNNNSLIAAGAMDTGRGRFSVKVPGLIESREDVFNLPVKSTDATVVTLDKIANIRRTFKDRENFTRINGLPAISVEVIRRPGTNLIDNNQAVRVLADEFTKSLPAGVKVMYSQDQSPFASQQVTELQGNIVTAMALVMTLVVAALGLRSGLLVGAAVPVSFLFSLIILNILGFSFNFMVMFGMLLGLGMLIDGAIVVTEYADRMMADGKSSREAYLAAAQRMSWPVIASTATTLAAFLPLFFWPGTTGKFMIYLPISVFAVLCGSLFYALIFGPTLGSYFGKTESLSEASVQQLRHLEHGNALLLKGFTGIYARLLKSVLRYPLIVLSIALVILFTIFDQYAQHNAGSIFFTKTDPTYGRISIRARGNFSREEIRDMVREAEQRIIPIKGIQTMFTSTSGDGGGFFSRGSAPADQVGIIFLEMDKTRNSGIKGAEVLEQAREALKDLKGIETEVAEQEYGPTVGKDIQIQVSSKFRQDLAPTIAMIRSHFDSMTVLRDVEDTRALPGIEWQLVVDRAQAAQFGANVNEVGSAVQLLTNGIYLGEFRPDDAEEEVEIRVRYPKSERNINVLDDLRINTPNGSVPLSNFVEVKAVNKLDSIVRIDGEYIMNIRANVMPGIVADTKIKEIQSWISQTNLNPRIRIAFRGANEEQAESLEFIGFAFLMALLLMFVLLVTQFNSFFQAFLILTSVVMSTAGVLLGLLIFNQTFSVMLTGVGIVALAGIVVNNNIVLIDTYNYLRKKDASLDVISAVIKTGAQRLRPVILTTFTTILGLLPLATNVSIDIINRDIIYNSQVSAYWVKLASSIVYGLTFATVLTLVITPVMLVLPQSLKKVKDSFIGRLPASTTA